MSSTQVRVKRSSAPRRVGDGKFRCGVSEIDITPHLDIPLAGYSAEGTQARGVRGHLFARVLYLRDGRGEDVAFCFMDLMSASRLLLEKVAALTARSRGLTVNRLVLAGTHTHTGPGWFYGNSLYDTFAAFQPGFDDGLCDWLASRIASAIESAIDSAREGRIAFGTGLLSGVSRNRSIFAFLKNPSWQSWTSSGFPGATIPSGLTLEQRSVDPRVSVIVATEVDESRPIGVFGLFGCHCTTLGPNAPYYSPDWAGEAVRAARWQLERSHGNEIVVAVGASAAGDVNGLRYGLEPNIPPGPALSRWVGGAIGRVMAETAESLLSSVHASNIDVWYAEPSVSDPSPPARCDVRLAERWYFGAATLGGSEESRTTLHKLGFTYEGLSGNEFSPEDPQYPKSRGGWILQDILKKLFDLQPSLVLPLHAVRIGGAMIATVPGEPTSWSAFDMETSLREVSGATEVRILGYTGDYGGYYTTRDEYSAQHYEGASMLFGRNASAHVAARLRQMVARTAGKAPAEGAIAFETVTDRQRFEDTELLGDAVPPDPHITRTGSRVEIRWHMAAGARVIFADGWWIRLETRTRDGSWTPARYMGRDFNDVSQPIGIHRIDKAGLPEAIFNWLGLREADEMWTATLDLPEYSDSDADLQVYVRARDGFPGFAVEVPPSL